jgi:hypothetical protein
MEEEALCAATDEALEVMTYITFDDESPSGG